jgi:hypothetical protein
MINKIQNMNGIKIRIGGMAKAIYNKIGKGMRPGRMALGMMLATMLGLVACDEHRDFPDTGMKVGHILCTDGEVMSYEDYNQSGKEAIAVVFHLNRDEAVAGNGYAVYLHDLAPEAFADSIGIVPVYRAVRRCAYPGQCQRMLVLDFDRSGRTGGRQSMALLDRQRCDTGNSQMASAQSTSDSHAE